MFVHCFLENILVVICSMGDKNVVGIWKWICLPNSILPVSWFLSGSKQWRILQISERYYNDIVQTNFLMIYSDPSSCRYSYLMDESKLPRLANSLKRAVLRRQTCEKGFNISLLLTSFRDWLAGHDGFCYVCFIALLI